MSERPSDKFYASDFSKSCEDYPIEILIEDLKDSNYLSDWLSAHHLSSLRDHKESIKDLETLLEKVRQYLLAGRSHSAFKAINNFDKKDK